MILTSHIISMREIVMKENDYIVNDVYLDTMRDWVDNNGYGIVLVSPCGLRIRIEGLRTLNHTCGCSVPLHKTIGIIGQKTKIRIYDTKGYDIKVWSVK